MERKFLIVVLFFLLVLFLVTQTSAQSMTSLSTLLHWKPLLCWILLLITSIFMENKEQKREEGITALIEVTETEGNIMEGDD